MRKRRPVPGHVGLWLIRDEAVYYSRIEANDIFFASKTKQSRIKFLSKGVTVIQIIFPPSGVTSNNAIDDSW